MTESDRAYSNTAAFDSFVTAPLHSRAEVLARPSPVPAAPGVYGWWFRRLPDDIDATACLHRDGVTLLYTGISPSASTVQWSSIQPPDAKEPHSLSLHRQCRGVHAAEEPWLSACSRTQHSASSRRLRQANDLRQR